MGEQCLENFPLLNLIFSYYAECMAICMRDRIVRCFPQVGADAMGEQCLENYADCGIEQGC